MQTSPDQAGYGRSMSPGDWLMLAHPQELSMEVQLCVEGDGVIDPGDMTAAVAAASAACPGARLVARGRRWADSGQPPPVRVAGAAGFDPVHLDSPLLRKRLAGDGTNSCEVVLLRGSPSTVIFRAHHAVMDGTGTMLWQDQVFRALRGEPVEGATSRLNDDEVKEEIAARLGITMPPWTPPEKLEWRSPLGRIPAGPRQSMWRRRTIDGVHPAATAKVARVVAAHGDARGLMGIPVDTRLFLPGLRTTSAVSGMVKIRIAADDDWNDVHASLLATLSEHQYLHNRPDPMWLQMPLAVVRTLVRQADDTARKNDEIIGRKGLANVCASVSHLGTVDLASCCTDGFTATSYYVLGGVAFYPEINIVESQGRTEVSVAWRDGPGLAGQAETLLDQIEEELSPAARRTWDANHTGHTAPPATLTSLFADQARRTPDATAVSSADGDLTYAELDQRSDAVAAALTARGAGRNDRVGLVAGRSPAAIVAVWGILKAGAGYLPIDDGYPDARISQLLTDAGAQVCLLEPHVAGRDFLPPGCAGIPLDSVPPAPGQVAGGEQGRPEDLACVIYTSGSTGAPKGVEIEHRSLVNYARWATREAGLGAEARMPLIASISFDMAGCAIYLPLLSGGTVLPVREVNALTLREVMENGGANVLAITPSHLDLINQAGIRESGMRVIMTAGELLRRSTALRAREVFGPQCRILCQWGPTETTIVNTSHEFEPETDTEPGVPFGRPMDNNTVHVLDTHGRFVPPGEPGEAYVGGVQVARGYLGQPGLTRQRFVRLADGTRVYRTGDIVRLLPRGELAFISRIDDQVKVAGHRIEPAEVAQVLEEHGAVQQAAVVARARPGHQTRELCGYVVCPADPGSAELKEFLASRLPRYMVPAAIVAVPDIPRTSNGKTAWRQLPDPFAGTASTGTSPDRDEVAAAVAAIWARTLQVDAGLVTDEADFHQLGGNSILLLSMIREVFTSVVEREADELIGTLGPVLAEPTLGRVTDFARSKRAEAALAGGPQEKPDTA